MTQSPSGPRRGGLLRVLMGAVLFVALLIFTTGLASLLSDTDVIEVSGFGQLPAVVGVIFATLAFIGTVAPAVLRGHPRYRVALWAAVGCYFAYLLGIFLAGVFGGHDPALVTSIIGRLATFWYAPLVALSAALAAFGVIAITQTREHGVRGARWPWEDDER